MIRRSPSLLFLLALALAFGCDNTRPPDQLPDDDDVAPDDDDSADDDDATPDDDDASPDDDDATPDDDDATPDDDDATPDDDDATADDDDATSSDCQVAETLLCNAPTAGNNGGPGSTNAIDSWVCSSFPLTGPEYAFAFAAPVDGSYTVTVSGLSADLDLLQIDGTECRPSECSNASQNFDLEDESIEFDANGGDAFVFVVDGYDLAVSDFTIEVACALGDDDDATADDDDATADDDDVTADDDDVTADDDDVTGDDDDVTADDDDATADDDDATADDDDATADDDDVTADDDDATADDDDATPPGPAEGSIIVTEILQNPDGSDTNREWFELHNTTGSDIDLDGWTIADLDFDSITIAGSLIVPANGYLVLGETTDTGLNGGVTVAYAYGSGVTLGNGADELILTSASALEIDRVEWDDGSTFPDPNGASMSLDPGSLDSLSNDDGGAWCTSPASPFGPGPDLGSPGAANPACASGDDDDATADDDDATADDDDATADDDDATADDDDATPPVETCNADNELLCAADVDVQAGAPAWTNDVTDWSGCLTDADWTGEELVFAFTAPVSGSFTVTMTGLTDDLDLFLGGGACDPTACTDSSANFDLADESITWTATEGELYFIAADGWQGATSDFTIEITCPDGSCDEAAALALDCATPDSNNNGGPDSTDTGLVYACEPDTEERGPEVTYAFTAPYDGDYTFALSGFTQDLDLFVLDGASSCDPDACLGGSINADLAAESVTLTLDAGESAYVVVEGWNDAVSDYTLEVTCPDPACYELGELACFAPDVVSANDALGSTDNADSYDCLLSGFIGNETGPEVVYAFAPPSVGEYEIALSGTSDDLDLFLLLDDGSESCASAQCILSETTASGDETLGFTVTEPGLLLYFVIDGYADAVSPFTLTMDCPSCAAEQSLSCDSGSDSSATDSADSVDVFDDYSCNSWDYSGSEVIYAFQPSSTASYTVDLTNLVDDVDLLLLESDDGSCAGDQCIADSDNASTNDESITFTGEVGTTYYLVVDGFSGNHSSFDIALSCN